MTAPASPSIAFDILAIQPEVGQRHSMIVAEVPFRDIASVDKDAALDGTTHKLRSGSPGSSPPGPSPPRSTGRANSRFPSGPEAIPSRGRRHNFFARPG